MTSIEQLRLKYEAAREIHDLIEIKRSLESAMVQLIKEDRISEFLEFYDQINQTLGALTLIDRVVSDQKLADILDKFGLNLI